MKGKKKTTSDLVNLLNDFGRKGGPLARLADETITLVKERDALMESTKEVADTIKSNIRRLMVADRAIERALTPAEKEIA